MAPRPSIAVLPFLNMSDAPEQEYFSDGITEEIIHALTEHTQLKVIARTSSFSFKNSPLGIKEIGSRLKVDSILEGSVRRAGNELRITAQLINVSDDFHYWSATIDRQWEEIFTLQTEIALEIAHRVREQFGHFDLPDEQPYPAIHSSNAYQLYLKGLYAYHQHNPQAYQEAIHLWEASIALDGEAALVWARLAEVHNARGLFRMSSPKAAFDRAWACANQAIKVNPKEVLSHLAMARTRFCIDWHVKKASRYLLSAMELAPQHPEVMALHATYLAAGSRFQEGHNELKKALQLDPYSLNLRAELAQLFLTQGKYSSSLEEIAQIKRQKSGFIVAQYLEGRCCFMMGKYEDALEIFSHLSHWQGSMSDTAWLACCQWQMGNASEAKRLIELPVEDMFRQDPGLYYYPRILYHCLTGNIEQATELLADGMKQRAYPLLSFVADPAWIPMRSHPNFQELTKQYHSDFSFPREVQAGKYHSSKLSMEMADDIFHQLEAFMASHQPYLSPELNLRDLAAQLEVLPNYLSQVINERYEQNFYHFVNHYRIEAFKARLKQPNASQFTLLGHALECGFNSKTAFNTAFKRLIGMTPSQYKRQMLD